MSLFLVKIEVKRDRLLSWKRWNNSKIIVIYFGGFRLEFQSDHRLSLVKFRDFPPFFQVHVGIVTGEEFDSF
jgi:hypothetical protein